MRKNVFYKNIKSEIAVVILTIFEKLLGFVKQIIFALFFGSKYSTDIYYLAQNIVSIFNTCFHTSVPISFLSVFVHNGMRDKSDTEKRAFIQNTISYTFCIALLLTAFVWIISFFVQYIPFIKLGNNELYELKKYIRILAFVIIFFILSGMISSGLECLKIYSVSKFAPVFINLSVIILLVFCRGYGIVVAIYGTLIGIALHTIYAFILLYRKIRIKFVVPHNKSYIHDIFVLSIPIMLSTAISSINSFFDKIIATRVGEGAISALNYAHLVSIELVSAVVVTAISSIMISRFAESVKNRRYEELNKDVTKIISIMMAVIVPIVCVFILYADDIICIVFKRGAFGSKEVDETAMAFIGYSLGLFFLPIREVMVRVQYAYQDSKSPMINSVICVGFNVIMSYVLSIKLGIFGIAMATSCSIVLNAILNIFTVNYKRKNKIYFPINNVLIFTIIGLIAGVCSYFIQKYITFNVYIRFICNLIIYCAIYMSVVFITRYKMIKNLFLELKK